MNRHTSLIILLPLCILLSTQTQAQPESAAGANNETGTPIITVTKLDVTDQTLELSWEIRNDTGQDVWILAGYDEMNVSASVFMDKDGQTLLIRAHMDFPLIYISLHKLYGRYVLLRNGQVRTESLTLNIPVYPAYMFGSGRLAQGLEYATRLTIEIGYYTGDLPGMIRDIFEQPDSIVSKAKISHDKLIKYYFRGQLQFNNINEILTQRDEEILIPHTDQNLKGEQVIRTTVEDLRIPYEEKCDSYFTRPESPDVPPCTRVEIKFHPSMLEYYFPYGGQQSLLTASERQGLRSLKSILVDDQQRANAFVNDVNKMLISGGVVRQISMAHVVCYRDAEPLASFNIYNDNSMVTDDRDRYIYPTVTDDMNRYIPNGFPGLRKLTPQIRPFELRVQCAANLRNLWHRLRLYHRAEKERLNDSSSKSKIVYPIPTEWCDALERVYPTVSAIDDDEFIVRPHICPSAGEGKCHYAMNPNCKLDSPPDMVLLFETKSGWNQHGGPELFTFDNHDPKGGCVLLNDGTLKFIRTTEEFQQLRWN